MLIFTLLDAWQLQGEVPGLQRECHPKQQHNFITLDT